MLMGPGAMWIRCATGTRAPSPRCRKYYPASCCCRWRSSTGIAKKLIWYATDYDGGCGDAAYSNDVQRSAGMLTTTRRWRYLCAAACTVAPHSLVTVHRRRHHHCRLRRCYLIGLVSSKRRPSAALTALFSAAVA